MEVQIAGIEEKYAVLLMKYPVMMLRSKRCQLENQPTDAGEYLLWGAETIQW